MGKYDSYDDCDDYDYGYECMKAKGVKKYKITDVNSRNSAFKVKSTKIVTYKRDLVCKKCGSSYIRMQYVDNYAIAVCENCLFTKHKLVGDVYDATQLADILNGGNKI
jgi:late competence protein required for DNA uptake (superfamily II DNA/RNA helicase)